MNILFLIGKYPSYGGTEKVTTVLANAFVEKGYDISIASFEQPVPELAKELNPKIKLFELSYPVKSKANTEKLRHILLQNNVDIIINQWCLPFYVTQLCNKARKGTNCKLIEVHHNAPDSNARLENVKIELNKNIGIVKKIFLKLKLLAVKRATSLSLRYVYKHSDKYVVLSESFTKVFQHITNIKQAGKLIAIPNPVTLLDDSFVYQLENKLKEIIYVGRIDYNQKKVFRIVNLWKDLEENYPDWKLTIVGDGPDRQDVENLVKKFNLQRIEIAGFQNPIEYYKRASVLLLTSEYEGFGLVIVEGMTFGVVPVVYGSYSAVYDIIDNKKDGFITPVPYSQTETINCLKTLMTDANQRNEMAVNAVEKSTKFSLEAIVTQWEILFKTV